MIRTLGRKILPPEYSGERDGGGNFRNSGVSLREFKFYRCCRLKTVGA